MISLPTSTATNFLSQASYANLSLNKTSGITLPMGDKVPLDYVRKVGGGFGSVNAINRLMYPESSNHAHQYHFLISNEGYRNFQNYIAERGLKESALSDDEVAFYSLKANSVLLPDDIANVSDYKAYKQEKEEERQLYIEYQESYGEALSSIFGSVVTTYDFEDDSRKYLGNVNSVSLSRATFFMKDGPATVMTGVAGEARLVFDLNDNGRVDSYNNAYNNSSRYDENLQANQMLSLDSNKDGILDGADEYFDKLKFVVKDDNGNDKIIKVSSIMSSIDLEQFMDQGKINKQRDTYNRIYKLDDKEAAREEYDNVASKYAYNERAGAHYDESRHRWVTSGYNFRSEAIDPFHSYIDAKNTHKLLGYQEADAYFEQNANSDGWVDFRKTFGAVGAFSEYLNFAYTRKDANGNEYLQKFNSGYNVASSNIGDQLGSLQARQFNTLYSEYMKLKEANDSNNAELANKLEGNSFGLDIESLSEVKSADMIRLEKVFEDTTGLSFSLDNLQKVKSLVDQGKSLQAFKDMDEVVAMRKNEDGTFTLKFNTGRTVEVDELYYDTGDFVTLEGDKDKRASLLMSDELKPLDTNNDEKIDKSEIDFNNYAIERDGKLQTLQNAGVNSINLIRGGPQGTDYYMEMVFNEENKDDSYQTLYKLTDLSNPYKPDAMEKLKEYLNHPYQNTLEEERAKVYEGRG